MDNPNYSVDGVPPAIKAKITELTCAIIDVAFAGEAEPEDRTIILDYAKVSRMNLEQTIKTYLGRAHTKDVRDLEVVSIVDRARMADQKLANQKLANQKLANQKLANQKLANQKLANQKPEGSYARQSAIEAARRRVREYGKPSDRVTTQDVDKAADKMVSDAQRDFDVLIEVIGHHDHNTSGMGEMLKRVALSALKKTYPEYAR